MTTTSRGRTGRPRRALVESGAEDLPLARLPQAALHQEPRERERQLHAVAARLDLPMTMLGILFLLVVLAQTVSANVRLQQALAVVSWLLWAVFVAEFLLRLALAPSKHRFLSKHWWQVIFLVLPMLRFLRLLVVLRVARAGRVVSSAVRSSRSAGRVLSSRLGWLGAVTAIVVLATSQLLYAFGSFASYADALHGAALATITGEPLGREDPFSRVIEVLLAAYSVAVFAGLAGSLGAYFLEPRLRGQSEPEPESPAGERHQAA